MEQLLGAAGTQASKLTGKINVTVVAAGPNGTSTANELVMVEFMHNEASLKKLELKTDGQGKVVLPDVPLMPPVDVELSMTHAGVVQRATAPDLSFEMPVRDFEWKVFETTEQEPAWTVSMQHMIVHWSEDGNSASVMEVMSINNPGERAWVGNKTAEGKRVTMAVPLPPGAQDINLFGFEGETTRLADGQVVTGTLMPPGRADYRLSYFVPVKGGHLELPIAITRSVESLRVFLPADDTTVKATGLTDGGTIDTEAMGGGILRIYRADGLAAGTTASLSVTGIKPAEAEGDLAAVRSRFSARNVALGGAFLLVLAGAALMLMKKPQPRKN